MDVRRALGIGGTVLVLLLAGCAADAGPVAQPSSAVVVPSEDAGGAPTAGPAGLARLGPVTDHDCTGDCAAGFELSGQEYLLSCEAIPPSNLGPEAVAEGTLYDRQVEVRKITAGARSGAVAVGPMADYCGPRQPPAEWYLYAYPV